MDYRISVTTTLGELQAIAPRWQALFSASATKNPFAHPTWLSCWAEHFVPDGDLYVLCVTDGTELVAVAPFFRDPHVRAVGRLGTRLRLLGIGSDSAFTELTQVLIKPGHERRVLREIMHHLAEDVGRFDWVELTLPPEHGWFEQEWLPQVGPRSGAVGIPAGTQCCVAGDLAADWDSHQQTLKRSAREAIRRSRRGLERDGHRWRVEFMPPPDELEARLSTFLTLHRARAGFRGRTARQDYFSHAAHRNFLLDVARRLYADRHFTASILWVDDRPVAGALILRANGEMFFSMTGFDPAWWRHSPLVLLQAECLRAAIEAGDTSVNFSVGPTVAKLRWTESLRQYNRFLVLAPDRRSRAMFGLYLHWQARRTLAGARPNPGTPALERRSGTSPSVPAREPGAAPDASVGTASQTC